MKNTSPSSFPNISLSHFELYVDDLSRMEQFYTECLGFLVTDRGEGEGGMVFLSRNPNEHHQLVLSRRRSNDKLGRQLDHIAFRVDNITNLRVFHKALVVNSATVQTVSHGTTWSIYFLDPENNRLELFVDTPWYVSQPCRFEVDFELTDAELYEYTERRIMELPGFIAVDPP